MNVDVEKYQPGLWLFSSVIKIHFTTFLQNYLGKTQRYPKNLKSNLVHQSLLLTGFHFKRQLKSNHVPNICSQCSCATLYRFSANAVDLKTYWEVVYGNKNTTICSRLFTAFILSIFCPCDVIIMLLQLTSTRWYFYWIISYHWLSWRMG